MSWVKWYRSKTAWVIIIAAVVAMVGAFLCAYYLAYPLNLITAIVCCVPSGIVMRMELKKVMAAIIEENNKGELE